MTTTPSVARAELLVIVVVYSKRVPGVTGLGVAAMTAPRGHHIEHWLHGGRTSLDNLVMLCSFHHRQIHEGGFSIQLVADGGVEVRGPASAQLPRWLKVPKDVGGVVWEDWWNNEVFGGASVNAFTALPQWDGDPVDYCAAVDALSLAVGEAGHEHVVVDDARIPGCPRVDLDQVAAGQHGRRSVEHLLPGSLQRRSSSLPTRPKPYWNNRATSTWGVMR